MTRGGQKPRRPRLHHRRPGNRSQFGGSRTCTLTATTRSRSRRCGKHRAGPPPRGEDVLSTAVPIVRNGRTVGALEVEQSLSEVTSRFGRTSGADRHRGSRASARPGRRLDPRRFDRPAAAALAARPPAAARRATLKRARRRGAPASRWRSRRSSMRWRTGWDAVLESQRAFVADASHQLRTPAHGTAPSPRGRRGEDDDPAAAKELEAAERESVRLEGLVSDLLELASSEQPAAEDRADPRTRPTSGRTLAGSGERGRPRDHLDATARGPFGLRRTSSRRCSTTWSRTRSSTRHEDHP